MSELEKKVNEMARMLLSTDAAEAEKARKNLITLMNSGTSTAEVQRKKNVEEHIRDVLLEIGAPDHLIGHQYTVDAIISAIEDPKQLNKIVYSLYPMLAQIHDTTAARVERAIRHLVEVTFDNGDSDVLNKYFSNTISPRTGKPVNTQFIARIANVVKMRMKNAA